jgi:Putative prokaryotic signal transducing protein
MDDTPLEVVGAFLTRIDADLACGALQAAGIPAIVSADDAAGLRPHLWMGGVRVLVPASELERAREILAAADAVEDGADRPDDK